MLKIGTIGCGRVVEEGHTVGYEAVKDRARVHALSDCTASRCDIMGEKLGVPPERRYHDYHDMLAAEELDAVVVAVPHTLHESIALDCINAGLHILLEKPMAPTLEEAERIIHAVEKRGILLTVPHNFAWQGQSLEAIRLVRKGTIGEPRFVRWEVMVEPPWPGVPEYDPEWRTRRDLGARGPLIDNGYHATYHCRYLMNSPVTRVYARAGHYFADWDVDDLNVVVLEHQNGGVSVMELCWSLSDRSPQMAREVHGTKGSIEYDRDGHGIGMCLGGEWTYPDVVMDIWGFDKFFELFVDAILKGGAVPVTPQEASLNLKIILACYESAESGQPVDIHE